MVLQGRWRQTWEQLALPPDPLHNVLLLFPPALASHHRPVRAFCRRGSCQLHQHPADEAEVSPRGGTGSPQGL